MTIDVSQLFSKGLQELHLSLNTDAQQKLLHFLHFLQKWNRSYNLTAITDLPKMVSHHLLDSLAIAPYIRGETILDVGSGAGFPGIPLAVCFPHKHFTLLDSNGKKARFLIQAKAELQLPNIEIVQARVEQWPSTQKFAVITTRAVGPIKQTIAQSRQHLQPGGIWLFMKSERQHEDLETLLPCPIIHTLQIPGVPAPRYLIEVSLD